jgi:hypothetical protein
MSKFRIVLASTCFVFAGAAPAHADAGVPMIFITLPGMLLALVPIIILETFVLARRLSVRKREVLKATVMSNAVSTLVGLPIVWVILVAVQIGTGGGGAYGIDTLLGKFLAVTWQAPWLIPYESDLDWMVPAASLALLGPFFAASCLIELRVNRRMLSQAQPQKLRAGTRDANLLSYGLLAVVAIGWLGAVVVRRSA